MKALSTRESLPIFASIREASLFFERGSLGYGPVQGGRGYAGVLAEPRGWAVHPLAVTRVRSSLFDDEGCFPPGKAEFDHALVMRDVEHVWRGAPELEHERSPGVSGEPVRNP